MVRVKFRYLVVNFLYPAPASTTKSKDPVPELLQFHAPTPDAFHAGMLSRAIRDGVAELYGDYGVGMVAAGLKVNYLSPATSTAIIRCPRDHYEMAWAALTCMTKLPKPIDTPVVVRVVRVSGTIKKAEEEVIRRAQQIIRRARTSSKKEEDGIIQGVVRSVERRQDNENAVLAHVDDDDDSESMSE